MKNIWPKILMLACALIHLASCAQHQAPKKYKRYHAKRNDGGVLLAYNDYKKIHSDVKYTYRVKPSETMSVGIPVDPKFTSVKLKNKDVITTKNYNEDLEEILIGNKYVGQYKVGLPYQIEDMTYYPQEYDYYEEVGVASWYGDDFHGKLTANGEIYNSGALTAAHQTLPLPSMVRVTNLDNGKNVIVRVNDRGPFAKSRIIDLSEQAAKMLGYRERGTATVKIEYLEKETEALLKTLKVKNK